MFANYRMWNGFAARGLVDELHLMISPVAFGSGIPLFIEPACLELREVRRFDDPSNVQLRFLTAPARS